MITAALMARAQLQACYYTVFCPYPYTPYDALVVRATT